MIFEAIKLFCEMILTAGNIASLDLYVLLLNNKEHYLKYHYHCRIGGKYLRKNTKKYLNYLLFYM